MNEDENIEALDAWSLDTTDITARVAAAIGASAEPASEVSELLTELRAMRTEIAELRVTSSLLQDEIIRLRLDLGSRGSTRIAPYSPTEGLVRLS